MPKPKGNYVSNMIHGRSCLLWLPLERFKAYAQSKTVIAPTTLELQQRLKADLWLTSYRKPYTSITSLKNQFFNHLVPSFALCMQRKRVIYLRNVSNKVALFVCHLVSCSVCFCSHWLKAIVSTDCKKIVCQVQVQNGLVFMYNCVDHVETHFCTSYKERMKVCYRSNIRGKGIIDTCWF